MMQVQVCNHTAQRSAVMYCTWRKTGIGILMWMPGWYGNRTGCDKDVSIGSKTTSTPNLSSKNGGFCEKVKAGTKREAESLYKAVCGGVVFVGTLERERQVSNRSGICKMTFCSISKSFKKGINIRKSG